MQKERYTYSDTGVLARDSFPVCVGVEGVGGEGKALKSFEPGLEQRVAFSQVQLGPGGEQPKPRHEGRELHGHNHETVKR